MTESREMRDGTAGGRAPGDVVPSMPDAPAVVDTRDARRTPDPASRVAAALAEMPSSALVLHGRRASSDVAAEGLDHVVVGPGGVVLVDSACWGGSVHEWNRSLVRTGTSSSGVPVRRSMHADVARVHRRAAALSARLRVTVTPVVCLTGEGAERFGAPRMVRGIDVVPVDDLCAWLVRRPVVVEDDTLARLHAAVRDALGSSYSSGLRRTLGREARTRRRRPRARSGEAGRRPRGDATSSRSAQRRLRRRRERLRMVLTVAFLWSVFCASVTGVVTGVIVTP